jgi:hypothetical protein
MQKGERGAVRYSVYCYVDGWLRDSACQKLDWIGLGLATIPRNDMAKTQLFVSTFDVWHSNLLFLSFYCVVVPLMFWLHCQSETCRVVGYKQSIAPNCRRRSLVFNPGFLSWRLVCHT